MLVSDKRLWTSWCKGDNRNCPRRGGSSIKLTAGIFQPWGRIILLSPQLSDQMGGLKESSETEQHHATFLESFELEEKVAVAKQYAWDHPISTLFFAITIAMCSIPVVCFCVFMFTTTLLLFFGFVIVEGFVLTLASSILGAVLVLVGFFSLAFSTFLILSYFSIRLAQKMINKTLTKVPEKWGVAGPCDSTTKTE